MTLLTENAAMSRHSDGTNFTGETNSEYDNIFNSQGGDFTNEQNETIMQNVYDYKKRTMPSTLPQPPEKKRMTSRNSLGSEESEEKKIQRQQRNRQAARRSREKKNQAIADTQLNLQLLQAENQQLKDIINQLQESNKTLQLHLAHARANATPQTQLITQLQSSLPQWMPNNQQTNLNQMSNLNQEFFVHSNNQNQGATFSQPFA